MSPKYRLNYRKLIARVGLLVGLITAAIVITYPDPSKLYYPIQSTVHDTVKLDIQPIFEPGLLTFMVTAASTQNTLFLSLPLDTISYIELPDGQRLPPSEWHWTDQTTYSTSGVLRLKMPDEQAPPDKIKLVIYTNDSVELSWHLPESA